MMAARPVECRVRPMAKWTKYIAIATLVAVVVVVLIGMHATWRQCKADGGITVRGLFGLVCIKSATTPNELVEKGSFQGSSRLRIGAATFHLAAEPPIACV